MKNYVYSRLVASAAGRSPPYQSMLGLALCCLVFSAPNVAKADFTLARGSFAPTLEINEEHDSNIFANQFNSADWHTVLTPGAVFIRDAGLIRLDVRGGVNFQRFDRHSDENSNDPFFQAAAKWMEEDSHLEAAFDAYVRRLSEANVDVNARSRVQDRGFGGYFEHFTTEKLGYRLKANWDDRNYLLEGWSDVRVQGIGGEARYRYSQKLDAFVGLGKRWSDTYNVTGAFPPMDSQDTKASFGVEGEVFPKISGRVELGWVKRKFEWPVTAKQSGVTFDTSLNWRLTEETSLRFMINRDLDTTPVDQSVMRQVTGVEIHRTFREKLNINLNFSHAISNYLGVGISRRDKSYFARVGADYFLTKSMRTGIHVSYADTQSNSISSDYDRFIGGANFAFLF